MSVRPRVLESQLARAARAFPALLLTGPRRSGKTTLLRRVFPKADYRLLENPDELARVRTDPRGFVASLRRPAIIDEIQNAPDLFSYLRTLVDAHPQAKGRFLLTGSQEAPLMQGVTESMAGRVAIFQLLPFSHEENPKVSLLLGGFPEALARPRQASLWFRSYLQTYLERDVRAVSVIRDLLTFRRFLALLATRHGQILNKTELAAPLGLSVPAVGQWLSILEITGQVLLVPPFFENLGKRLIKSPKVYFVDSGLVCHLLGIESAAALGRSAFLGPIFEGQVASEIVKAQINRGRRREIYFFRDQQGLEVDFVVPTGPGRLAFIEAKATQTLRPNMAVALLRLQKAGRRYKTHAFVVCPGATPPGFGGLGSGVRGLGLDDLVGEPLGLRAWSPGIGP
ncbi:MAG TPA: ATP-binding protein [Polyangia bacterium]|nr:ATP-binding protein [Polyangia bacterium]